MQAGALAASALFWPAFAPALALGVWWGSNTIAHNFLHNPFFLRRRSNALFSLWLSALLGVPQTLWRQRHLAHHAGARWRLRWGRLLASEALVVLALWGALAVWAPGFFVTAYLPGYLLGLGLCALHGHDEHLGGTTSHYGGLYNRLFFNDGYHVEHHRRPRQHWTDLPRARRDGCRHSRWPPVARTIARWEPRAAALDGLERLALASGAVRRFLLRSHERAIRALLADRLRAGPAIDSVAIVGGGIFPRTAVILRRLLPRARIVCIDSSSRSLEYASAALRELDVETIEETFEPGRHRDFDLVVIPLAYRGDRRPFYRDGLDGCWLVHDWIWRRRGRSAIVSPWLLKRLNFVTGTLVSTSCAH